jgi:hypothetical protein
LKVAKCKVSGVFELLSMLRKLFFWNYARNTWQWDVLCVVILIFIFLTPKSWFENGERRALSLHQNPVASTVLVGAELVENADDRAQVEQVIRTVTNRPNVQVVSVRPVVGTDGKTRAYEVDIR